MSPPVVLRSTAFSMSVSQCVHVSQMLHVQTSEKFLYMLLWAMMACSSNDNKMFFFNGLHSMCIYARAVLEQLVKFLTYLPGSAIKFDSGIIYNSGKLQTRVLGMMTRSRQSSLIISMLPLVGVLYKIILL